MVKLSSSNMLVASVPGFWSCPEGALSATAAAMTHMALLFRTSSISAATEGATESAVLTVTS